MHTVQWSSFNDTTGMNTTKIDMFYVGHRALQVAVNLKLPLFSMNFC